MGVLLPYGRCRWGDGTLDLIRVTRLALDDMTNQIAIGLALIILAVIGWDIFLNDAFWVTTWAKRLFLIIEWARFWG